MKLKFLTGHIRLLYHKKNLIYLVSKRNSSILKPLSKVLTSPNNMTKYFLIVLLIVSNTIFAQEQTNNTKEKKPVYREVSNKEVIISVYPDAAKMDKVDNFWSKILDSKRKTLGFAMNSTPFCHDVLGYNNLTPVMIITDNKLVIQKIALLSHWETLGYVRKLEKKGFFNQWNGKTLQEAKAVVPDGYTSATVTAIAVSKNIEFLLTNGTKKLPKIKK